MCFHHVGSKEGYKDDGKAEKNGPSFFCEVHSPGVPGDEAAPGQEQDQPGKAHGCSDFKELIVCVGIRKNPVARLYKQISGGFGAYSEDGDVWIGEQTLDRVFPDYFTAGEEGIAIIIEEFSCAGVFFVNRGSIQGIDTFAEEVVDHRCHGSGSKCP